MAVKKVSKSKKVTTVRVSSKAKSVSKAPKSLKLKEQIQTSEGWNRANKVKPEPRLKKL
jgi:hypothetical protein